MEANGGGAEWSPPPIPVAPPAPAPMHQMPMPMMTPPPPPPPAPLSQTVKECFEESVAGAGAVAEDANKVPLCAGCRLRITDEFFLNAVEKKWHLNCLKCVECGVELEGQKSCFMKNGSIFCKEDFLR